MSTIKTKRPRIGQKSNPVKIANKLAELYEVTYFEALKVLKSQDYNIDNSRMILNLKKRTHEIV